MNKLEKEKATTLSSRVDYLLALMGQLHQVINTQLGQADETVTAQLTLGQMRILYFIMEAGPVTMREAANQSGVAMSTMSDMATRLVKLAVVQRISDPHDRRIVRLEITEKGIKSFSDKTKSMQMSMRGLLKKHSERDQQQLIKALQTVERILVKEKK